MAFFINYIYFPRAHVRSYALSGITIRTRALSLYPNWSLLEIIFQSRVILCIFFGPELDFIVDLPIPCVLNVIAYNQP